MDYIKIGKIGSTHGLDGKVILKQEMEGKKLLSVLTHIFIELQRESYIPYFIETQKRLDESQVVVQLEEVYSIEDARVLLGKNVFTEAEKFRQMHPNALSGDITGFTVKDEMLGEIGTVQAVMETPGQVIATVLHQGKEVLIPLAADILIRIDMQKKVICIALPDGLLDIYIG